MGHTAGIKADGTLWAWGYNNDGQIGDKSYQLDKVLPSKVGDNRWVALEAGSFHTLGIKSDGSLWAWGYNTDGQLGTGERQHQDLTVSIATGTTWKRSTPECITPSRCESDGSLWAWGDNFYGQLGDTTNHGPYAADEHRRGHDCGRRSSAGFQNSVGIRSDGTLWTWGDNFYGSARGWDQDGQERADEVIPKSFETNDLSGLPWTTSGNGVRSASTHSMHSGTVCRGSPPVSYGHSRDSQSAYPAGRPVLRHRHRQLLVFGQLRSKLRLS